MICIKCQKPLQKDFKFCPYCGSASNASCHGCGKDIQPEWSNCPHCSVPVRTVNIPPAAQPTYPPSGHPYPPQGHYGKHHYSSSSGYHRRKKGLLERFFS